MSILSGIMKIKVDGHKDLTDHLPVLTIKDTPRVYIPLINGASEQVEVFAKIGERVNVGTKLAQRNDHFTVPFFSSVSGTVLGIEKLMHPSGREIDHLVIENDFKYEKVLSFEPVNVEEANAEQLVEFVKNAGIVGCGGAGFPTYIKYTGCKGVHTVLINAVECEPYITADYKEISDSGYIELATGILAMIKMSGAQKAIIALKEYKVELIKKLREFLKDYPSIEVQAVPDRYPMGWEKTVVYEIFKKRYEKLPMEIGVVVNNSTTAISLGRALLTGTPIVEKVVTISGEALNNPQNVLVPVGTRIDYIIDKIGGFKYDEVLLIAGGPMMGRTIPNSEAAISYYSNSITVVEDIKEETIACLRCGKCSEFCPAALQPVRINEAATANDFKALQKLSALDCIECGICTYVCPSRIEVTQGVRDAKALLRKHLG